MKITLAVVLLCSCCFAADRNWKNGDLTKITASDSASGVLMAPVGNMSVAVPIQSHFIFYWIEVDELTYVLRLKDKKPLNVTLHGKVKIAIDSQNAYILDDEGKEKKLPIVQKIAKEQSK